MSTTVSAAPSALKVSGTHVVNAVNERVWLRGVNTACMEWTSDGEGHILDTVNTAIRDWKVNIIRVPLSQDRWFGKAPEQNNDPAAYRALVDKVVQACAAQNCYVMLDLHWSDAGVWGKQIGQHVMPDANSLAFWKDLAPIYKNNPAVLFDLYNEPHDITWDVWLNGGSVTESDKQRGYTNTYDAVGMQPLLDAVRSTGAKNVVVAGGLDWAYDMSGFLNGKQLKDPDGSGVIYANHNYPFKGDTFEKWLSKIETASKQIPIIVSEFGGGGNGRNNQQGDQWIRQVLQELQDRKLDWTAWDMHPRAGPVLVSDWNYTPTPAFGVFVKEALSGTLAKYTPALAAGAQAAAPPAGNTNGPVADPKMVIDKAITALGGEPALAKIKAASWKAKGTISFGGNDNEVTTTITVQGMDHIRQVFEGQFNGNAVKGVTLLAGDKGSRQFGDNHNDLDAAGVASQKQTVYLQMIPITLLPLKDKAYKVEGIADETVDGKPQTGLKVTPVDGKEFKIYFDKESGLPVRLVAKVAGFNGMEFTQETTFSDYKDMAGIKKAAKIVNKRDGQKFMEQQITEFKILDTVDPKTFTEP